MESILSLTNRFFGAGRIDEKLPNTMCEQRNYWKNVISRCVATDAFLCEKGLPLRENNEIIGFGNNDNYLGIFELIGQFNPFLSQHISRFANRGCGHSSYLSKIICERAALAHLDSLSPLMIWCFGQTTLFLFLLARAAPAFLPTALSVALRPLFPFRQAQYAQVFPLKPAPFCTLFAGLGSTNKSAIFLLFSYYLTLVLSSPPCPLLHLFSYLKLCGRSGRNCLLSPVLSDYNGFPDTPFYRETTRLMS